MSRLLDPHTEYLPASPRFSSQVISLFHPPVNIYFTTFPVFVCLQTPLNTDAFFFARRPDRNFQLSLNEPKQTTRTRFGSAAGEKTKKGAATEVAGALRRKGVSVDLVLETRKTKANFKHATRVGATYVVMVAPSEWKAGKVGRTSWEMRAGQEEGERKEDEMFRGCRACVCAVRACVRVVAVFSKRLDIALLSCFRFWSSSRGQRRLCVLPLTWLHWSARSTRSTNIRAHTQQQQ